MSNRAGLLLPRYFFLTYVPDFLSPVVAENTRDTRDQDEAP